MPEPCDRTLGGGDGMGDRLECARRSSISLMLGSAALPCAAGSDAGAVTVDSPGVPVSGMSGIWRPSDSIGAASACGRLHSRVNVLVLKVSGTAGPPGGGSGICSELSV